MNVLSLFDGMSCGQIALNRLGIKVDNYFACEIDKWAIKVTQKNFPNTVQLGSVTDLHGVDTLLPKIDLIIGGSPCQGFSFAGKQLNFEDPRSKLFFEFVRIWQECKQVNPEIKFLLENVRMKKEYQNVISEYMGVEPIEINSALVSAQNRKRLFWTDIPNITQPEDKGILLRDIIHENVDLESSAISSTGKAHCLTARYSGAQVKNSFERSQRTMVFEELERYIVPFDKTLQILNKEIEKGKIGYFQKNSKSNRVYFIHGQNVVLRVPEATKKGYVDIQPGQGVDLTFPNSKTRRGRKMTDKSNCLTATNHFMSIFGCITPDRVEKRQNGQRFNEGKKFYTLTAQDRHGILVEGYIRKLTPIECERLQTVPDHYTDGVSNSQRYKMLGNGWTVDVICHILKNL